MGTSPRPASRGWRDRDPFAPSQRPGSVRGVVLRVHRALRLLRWAEGLIVGLAGLFVTRAAALVGDVEPGSGTWFVCALAGLAAGLAWEAETRASVGTVLRRMDRALRHQGALVTAYECEARGVRTPLAGLLLERVRARLRTREAIETLRPPVVPPLFAFLGGLAVLILAQESRGAGTPDTSAAPDVEGRARAAAEGLASLADRTLAGTGGRELDHEERGELLELKARSRELAQRLAGKEPRDEELEPALRELQRDLAEAVERLRHGGLAAAELRQLETAQAWLDAAHEGLDPAAGRGEAGAGGSGAPGAGDGTGAGRTGVSPAEPAPVEPAPRPPASGPAGSSAPTGRAALSEPAIRWPAEYDSLIEAWIERRRSTADGGGR